MVEANRRDGGFGREGGGCSSEMWEEGMHSPAEDKMMRVHGGTQQQKVIQGLMDSSDDQWEFSCGWMTNEVIG